MDTKELSGNLSQFKDSGYADKERKNREDHLAEYQKYSKEIISKYSPNQLYDFFQGTWAKTFAHKNKGSVIKAFTDKRDAVIEAIDALLFSGSDVATAWDDFYSILARNELRWIGKSTVTELLMLYDPSYCVLVNGQSIPGLKKLGVKVNIKDGDDYKKICDQVKALVIQSEKLGYDFDSKNGKGAFNFDSFVRFIAEMKNFGERGVSRKDAASPEAKILEDKRTKLGSHWISESPYKDIVSRNVIYYGVPGSGKSYEVNYLLNNTLKMDPAFIVRTTFYPEYTYSDFVGQVMPRVVNHEPIYEFVPGPFTKALSKALENEEADVVLVIEEINRGNASAIFGDIFQLLDRDNKGNSDYPIDNTNINQYLESQGLKGINQIRIPSNLYIFATMNTSDQNVYPLDTAFKRRWEMVLVNNDVNSCQLKDLIVPKLGLNWATFLTSINKLIRASSHSIHSEDKQLGVYFVSKEDLLSEDEVGNPNIVKWKAKKFGEKVLQYLWFDVSAMKHDEIFDSKIETFEDLMDTYLNSSIGTGIFNSQYFVISSEGK